MSGLTGLFSSKAEVRMRPALRLRWFTDSLLATQGLRRSAGTTATSAAAAFRECQEQFTAYIACKAKHKKLTCAALEHLQGVEMHRRDTLRVRNYTPMLVALCSLVCILSLVLLVVRTVLLASDCHLRVFHAGQHTGSPYLPLAPAWFAAHTIALLPTVRPTKAVSSAGNGGLSP